MYPAIPISPGKAEALKWAGPQVSRVLYVEVLTLGTRVGRVSP